MGPCADCGGEFLAASVQSHSEEVDSIVDEADQRERPKRARVLRATDIIPPFDNVPAPAEPAQQEPDAAVENEWPEDSTGDEPSPDGESSPDAAADDIPKYDLAENILAEQRRVAARRRRRTPSQPQEELPAQPELRSAEPIPADLPSEDLPELQRVVAEIVARDIERLCRRSDN